MIKLFLQGVNKPFWAKSPYANVQKTYTHLAIFTQLMLFQHPLKVTNMLSTDSHCFIADIGQEGISPLTELFAKRSQFTNTEDQK